MRIRGKGFLIRNSSGIEVEDRGMTGFFSLRLRLKNRSSAAKAFYSSVSSPEK
jgi:hypothetical protein